MIGARQRLVLGAMTAAALLGAAAVAMEVAQRHRALQVATGPQIGIAELLAPFEGELKALSLIPGAAELELAWDLPQALTLPGALPLAPGSPPADCTPRLVAQPAEAAMVRLGLSVPCHPHQTVRISHSLVELVAETDAAGRLDLMLPALAPMAEFTAVVQGLAPVMAQIAIPDIDKYDRIVVAWEGAAAIELHAFEEGAGPADAGHVWHDTPRDASWASTGKGGFALRLGGGATPAVAEVYTYPVGHSAQDGSIRVTLESEVTSINCGRDVAGKTMLISQGLGSAPADLRLAMPDCAAQGNYLVLDRLFPALQLAAR